MKLYAFINNENLMESSSGGAFMALAKGFFSKFNNAIVYGCANINNNIKHIRIDKYEECYKLQGSKYVMSNLSFIIKELQEDLRSGKVVLFIGTPCQVSSIKKMVANMNNLNDNLYTIDLICHGTNRNNIWEDYLKWLEKKYKSKITNYNFRYKKQSWGGYPVLVEFENGKKIIDNYDSRVLNRMFFKHYSMNYSCYNCKFKRLDREGDITLGDFWGIDKIDKSIDTKNGVSLLRINNKKGNTLFNNIEKDSTFCKKVENLKDDFLEEKYAKKIAKPLDFENFNLDYKNKGFEYIIKKYHFYTLLGKMRYYIIVLLKKIRLYNLFFKIRGMIK